MNDYSFDHTLNDSLNFKNLKLPSTKRYSTTLYGGPRWHSVLRIGRFAGSIPAGVIGIFH